MGVQTNCSSLDLIHAKVKSWVAGWWGVESDKFLMSGVSDRKICYGCRSHLSDSADGHRCQSCGLLFCLKCMERAIGLVGSHLGSGITSEYESGQPKVCEFCAQAIGRGRVAMEYDERMGSLASPRRFRVARPPSLMELQQCSPLSLRCSTARTDEEDEEDIGKNFWSPCSVFSQDVSDMDSSSFSTGNEPYSFKSFTPSPLDSPSRAYEHGERSPTPTSQKTDLLEQGSLDNLRISEKVTGSCVENAYTSDYMSIYRDREGQEAQNLLNVEYNDSIWFPPPPEDEEDDAENGFFEYEDEDDDVGQSGMLFPSSSFGDDEFPIKEKAVDAQKELLRTSVHGHFRALVSQLLKGEGIPAGNDDGEEGWLEVVSSLAWQAANFVKPDTSREGSMDPGHFVKVKCILSGSPKDSTLVKGVVCTKNVKLKRMISQHTNPRLLLLGGALEFQKVSNKLASIETILQEEIDHLKMAVSKIVALRPNVLLVEKSVSLYAQEYLLAKEISLVLNVKRPLLERISRCTGAQISHSIDGISSTRLGSCQVFRVERTTEECSSGNQSNKKSSRTLMFFDGCPKRLGCTVLLRGTCCEELKKVKHVLQYASFAAYHLSLETSFLADSGAALPKLLHKSPAEISTNSVLMRSASTNSMQLVTRDENQALDPSGVYCTYHLPCQHVSSPNYTAFYYKNGQGECESSNDYDNSSPTCSILSPYSRKRGLGSAVSAPDLTLSLDHNYGFPCEDMHGRMGFSTDLCEDVIALREKVPEKGGTKNRRQHEEGYEGGVTGMCFGSDAPVSGDYISTSENQQSILVSLSSSSVLKGTICERSKLLRIKFYGSFDKPLGRYLHDDLFDQTSYCMCCKEPPEAHVRCFTHQQGNLTISVKRLSSMKLPGEHDGRIWMWHRCLKCTQKDGVPPATCRVVMSEAAWGLSFGKFLELSFSNHATANRVASCGHSLQRDCLRFFGLGSIVAVFRYSPVDILSVRLPPPVLEFNCQSPEEWFRREVAEVSSKVELLYGEVYDVLSSIEKKITNAVNEPSKASLCNVLMELKDLLKNERYKYNGLLQPESVNTFQTGQAAVDILELNYLRRSLLIDSYVWDRRIYLLDCKVKGSSSEIDAHLSEISTHNDLIQRSESLSENVRLDGSSNGLNEKTTTCSLNEPIGMELSVKPVECRADAACADSVSYANCSDLHKCSGAAVGESSLESLPSPGSSLSDKIDLAWTGTGHSVQVPASNVVGGLQDNVRYRKVITPVRVYASSSLGVEPRQKHISWADECEGGRLDPPLRDPQLRMASAACEGEGRAPASPPRDDQADRISDIAKPRKGFLRGPHYPRCGRCIARQRRDRLRRRQRCSVAKVSCSPSSALEANKGVLGSQGPSQGSAWTTTEEKSQEIESCSVSRFPAEAFVGRESDGVGHSVCDELEGGDGCCYGEEDNPLLPFARMSEELFQASPVSRLLGSVTERDSERELGPEQGQIVPFALPPPPTMSEDLRIAMEQVEDAYMGKESVTGDNGCLSKSEVKDILTKMEHFMETQACDTAMKIGVSFDGVDKGLKSSMLLIKRRWMADMARKAKADVAGKANSEES